MSKLLLKYLLALFFVAFGTSYLAAQDTLPKVIRGGIINGKAVSLPKPVYPEAAKAAKIEGIVIVDVVVNEEGKVESAAASSQPEKLVKAGVDPETADEVPPADPMLREAAEQAALKAEFAPTMLSGQPVKIIGKIVYTFRVAADFTNIHQAAPGAVSGGILNSKATSLPLPAYPAAAKAVNAGGGVSVKVLIDEEGSVISAEAVSGHPLLRSAAVEAARLAAFSPTRLSGQPVKVSGVLVYNFVQ